ncbi:alpha/beta hydrolase [Rhodopila sp.]|uniref:alpha/beta hydrolase n=1 Tax=Rhodopila sp. TaxID=2480087 RepID=UPI003D128409
MQPVIVNNCFGWLHTNRETSAGSVAVLICTGLDKDARDSYQAFRVLADNLADAGYPTMRYHYPGTGDSGDIEDQESLAAWLNSVDQMADWLRTATGARHLVLVGLRIGAALATLTAGQRSDISGLILLAPVTRGRPYIRQLFVEAQLQNGLKANKHLDFNDVQLSAETVQRIVQVDLRHVKLNSEQQVVIFSHGTSTAISDCCDAWRKLGVKVSLEAFTGLEEILRHDPDTMSNADFSKVIGWLCQAMPPDIDTSARTSAIHTRMIDCISETSIASDSWIETPIRFGPRNHLFGILSRPRLGNCARVVIIANTGRNPHYGVSRGAVNFARVLAIQGIASFRIDFSGLGDSLGPIGREDLVSSTFETDRTPDIVAAVDAMQQIGFTDFAVHGICSGAYHVWRAALTEQRIDAILLVNMPLFVWRLDKSIDFAKYKSFGLGHFIKKTIKKNVWRRVLKREVSIYTLMLAQLQRLNDKTLKTVTKLAQTIGSSYSIGWITFSRRAMDTLSRRGVKTLFMFAPGDTGLFEFFNEFGRDFNCEHEFPGSSMIVVPELDHALNHYSMHKRIAELSGDFINTCLSHRIWPEAAGRGTGHPAAESSTGRSTTKSVAL